jgi:GLPGLI family protein
MGNDNGINLEMLRMVSAAKGTFYNNLKTTTKLHQKDAFGKQWRIKQKTDTVQWEIENETRIIKGYRCRKATTIIDFNHRKRGEVTAWFCPDLPFQFGPLGFAGLPGLIFRIKTCWLLFLCQRN